jgi:hypothetical protein
MITVHNYWFLWGHNGHIDKPRHLLACTICPNDDDGWSKTLQMEFRYWLGFILITNLHYSTHQDWQTYSPAGRYELVSTTHWKALFRSMNSPSSIMFCREVTVEAPVAHLCILKPKRKPSGYWIRKSNVNLLLGRHCENVGSEASHNFNWRTHLHIMPRKMARSRRWWSNMRGL